MLTCQAHDDVSRELNTLRSSSTTDADALASLRADADGQIAALSEELQEALDALSTLEKALHESTEERDRLAGLLDSARSSSAGTSADTDRLRGERDAAREALRELEARMAASSEGHGLGLGLDEGSAAEMLRIGSSSTDSSMLEWASARPSPMPPQPSTLPSPTPLSPSYARAPHSSASVPRAPPPTAPPSVPPPPPPTSLPAVPNGPHTSLASTSTSRNVRSSSASSVAPHDSPNTSNGHAASRSSTDSLTVDPRVQRKLEEQQDHVRPTLPVRG